MTVVQCSCTYFRRCFIFLFSFKKVGLNRVLNSNWGWIPFHDLLCWKCQLLFDSVPHHTARRHSLMQLANNYKRTLEFCFHSHTIHGTAIFTYICVIFMVHIGKCTVGKYIIYHTWMQEGTCFFFCWQLVGTTRMIWVIPLPSTFGKWRFSSLGTVFTQTRLRQKRSVVHVINLEGGWFASILGRVIVSPSWKSRWVASNNIWLVATQRFLDIFTPKIPGEDEPNSTFGIFFKGVESWFNHQQDIFYVSGPYFVGKWSNLTSIFLRWIETHLGIWFPSRKIRCFTPPEN